jgi:hypothetical protein
MLTLHRAVLEVEREGCPARQGIADCPGKRALARQPAQLVLQPGLEGCEPRPALGGPPPSAFVGRASANAGLDVVEFADPFEGFPGQQPQRLQERPELREHWRGDSCR